MRHKTLHIYVQDSVEKTFLLSMTGLLLYIPAVTMPIMTFTVLGLTGSGNVIDSIMVMFEKGFYFVGSMVLLVSLLFPLAKLALLFWLTGSLKMQRYSENLHFVFRAYKHLSR